LSSIEERSPRSPFHPTLDEIKRKLVKFVLFDHGLSYTIDVASCSTAIDVLEKVLRKKAGANPHDGDPPLLHAYTANGGLTVDGWGVYLDFGQQDGPGVSISLSLLYPVSLPQSKANPSQRLNSCPSVMLPQTIQPESMVLSSVLQSSLVHLTSPVFILPNVLVPSASSALSVLVIQIVSLPPPPRPPLGPLPQNVPRNSATFSVTALPQNSSQITSQNTSPIQKKEFSSAPQGTV